jgi:hypothetical protein
VLIAPVTILILRDPGIAAAISLPGALSNTGGVHLVSDPPTCDRLGRQPVFGDF